MPITISSSGAAASGGTPAVVLSPTAAAGVASTFLRTDDQLIAFDATVPVTQASADAAATGTAATAARRDHKHGMPTISAGAVARVGGVLTEATTTSTTDVSIQTVTGLSLASPLHLEARFIGRKSSGGAFIGALGLKINAAIIYQAQNGGSGGASPWIGSATNQAEDGIGIIHLAVAQTNYTLPVTWGHTAASGAAGTTGGWRDANTVNAAMPVATITDVILHNGNKQPRSLQLHDHLDASPLRWSYQPPYRGFRPRRRNPAWRLYRLLRDLV